MTDFSAPVFASYLRPSASSGNVIVLLEISRSGSCQTMRRMAQCRSTCKQQSLARHQLRSSKPRSSFRSSAPMKSDETEDSS